MLLCLPHFKDEPKETLPYTPRLRFCMERTRLQSELLSAIREVSALLSQQTQAVIDGDPEFARFDILLQMAQQRKEMAKYAWISHVESHHCE